VSLELVLKLTLYVRAMAIKVSPRLLLALMKGVLELTTELHVPGLAAT
jgi:hypothetical protein